MKAWIAAFALLFAAPLAAQPQDITTPGTVPHRIANTAFPETVGDFRRIGVTRFDDTGHDISAAYQRQDSDGLIRISVYIYPAAGPSDHRARVRFCREHFEGVEQAIRQTYPGARRIERGPLPDRAGVGGDLAQRSVFRLESDFGRGKEVLISESRLYCFVAGDWLVKYRISASEGIETSSIVESFVRRGPWPGYMPGEVALR